MVCGWGVHYVSVNPKTRSFCLQPFSHMSDSGSSCGTFAAVEHIPWMKKHTQPSGLVCVDLLFCTLRIVRPRLLLPSVSDTLCGCIIPTVIFCLCLISILRLTFFLACFPAEASFSLFYIYIFSGWFLLLLLTFYSFSFGNSKHYELSLIVRNCSSIYI